MARQLVRRGRPVGDPPPTPYQTPPRDPPLRRNPNTDADATENIRQVDKIIQYLAETYGHEPRDPQELTGMLEKVLQDPDPDVRNYIASLMGPNSPDFKFISAPGALNPQSMGDIDPSSFGIQPVPQLPSAPSDDVRDKVIRSMSGPLRKPTRMGYDYLR